LLIPSKLFDFFS